MKVLLAGATGAIGRPIINSLVRARHQVLGITTTDAGLRTLRDNGADGIIANILDAEAVMAGVRSFRPDAVIDELTSLPKNYTPDEMRAAAAMTAK